MLVVIPEHLDPLGYFDLFGIRFLRVIPMAGKSRPMSQIKQLIRLKQQCKYPIFPTAEIGLF